MKEIYMQYHTGLYIKLKQISEYLWDKFFWLDDGKWVYQNTVDYYGISIYDCDLNNRRVNVGEIRGMEI